ncbi:hypothetical protein ACH5RR_017972 [Cinchona calisaya]|uniref:F-box protein n=1 Tax=Cinchona calisaya TaxID=153742 RepID=A0ABD2ZKG8_9GENT
MENLVVFNQTVEEEEEEIAENLFNRLPEELIKTHIFSKISEAKSLCFCSLVSKRFSSFVFQSKTVSIKIPRQIPNQQPYPTNRRTPAKYISNLTIKFLAKLTSLRTLYVEFDCSVEGGGVICSSCSSTNKEPVVKWKVDLSSASFVMIFARTLNVDVEIDDRIGTNFHRSIRPCFLNHLKDASLRFSLMKTLIRLLPKSLENIVVTDSKKQGGMINHGGNEVVDVKKIKGFNVRNFLGGYGAIKYWHEKKPLKLPVSGIVMKRVAVIRYKENWVDNPDDDLLVAKEAFKGEEEEVFGEALKELLTIKNVDNGFMWVGI